MLAHYRSFGIVRHNTGLVLIFSQLIVLSAHISPRVYHAIPILSSPPSHYLQVSVSQGEGISEVVREFGARGYQPFRGSKHLQDLD